jgi:hypothetical protein
MHTQECNNRYCGLPLSLVIYYIYRRYPQSYVALARRFVVFINIIGSTAVRGLWPSPNAPSSALS